MCRVEYHCGDIGQGTVQLQKGCSSVWAHQLIQQHYQNNHWLSEPTEIYDLAISGDLGLVNIFTKPKSPPHLWICLRCFHIKFLRQRSCDRSPVSNLTSGSPNRRHVCMKGHSHKTEGKKEAIPPPLPLPSLFPSSLPPSLPLSLPPSSPPVLKPLLPSPPTGVTRLQIKYSAIPFPSSTNVSSAFQSTF